MQYILVPKKTPSIKIVFNYDFYGFLNRFDCEGITNEKQLEYLFWNADFPFPYIESLIKKVKALGKFNIQVVNDDLSFERFWDEYNYKVSKKKAEKLWQKLTRAEKIKVFIHLPKYEAYLTGRSIEKAYPDTYLRNKRFEDEY